MIHQNNRIENLNEEKKELVEHSWDIGELYLQEVSEHWYNSNRQ